VWTLRKGITRIDCEFVFRGESYGWEARLLENGELVYGRRYPFRSGAQAEATCQLARWRKEGFALPATEPSTE
jgi:hypothetical protein